MTMNRRFFSQIPKRSFLRVPIEVTFEIFEFLEKPEILSLHYVCRYINELLMKSQGELFFKRICIRKWGENITKYPRSILEGHYQNSYRRLYLSDFSEEYNHYSIFSHMQFKNAESVREYDNTNGRNLESQSLKMLDLGNLFCGRTSDKPSGLEEAFERDKYWFFDGPLHILQFSAIEEHDDGRVELMDETVFPTYYSVFHYPGDNSAGFIFEGNSMEPCMKMNDGEFVNYTPGDHHKKWWELRGIREGRRVKVFNRLWSFHPRLGRKQMKSETKVRSCHSLNSFVKKLSSKDLVRIITNSSPVRSLTTSRNAILVHFVEGGSRERKKISRWGQISTIQKEITEVFGDESERRYEERRKKVIEAMKSMEDEDEENYFIVEEEEDAEDQYILIDKDRNFHILNMICVFHSYQLIHGTMTSSFCADIEMVKRMCEEDGRDFSKVERVVGFDRRLLKDKFKTLKDFCVRNRIQEIHFHLPIECFERDSNMMRKGGSSQSAMMLRTWLNVLSHASLGRYSVLLHDETGFFQQFDEEDRGDIPESYFEWLFANLDEVDSFMKE